MKILLVGACGRMGKEVVKASKDFDDVDIVKTVDMRYEKEDVNHNRNINDVEGDFDAIIDFSAHDATISTLKVAIVRRVGVVICTTGHSDEERNYIEYASRFIPVFCTSNVSIGMALLRKFTKEIALKYPCADVEIVETHHTQKSDAPSGSALSLADEILCARGGQVVVGRNRGDSHKSGDIGIHSLRMGEEVGEHLVIFNTGDEIISISHRALSRAVYAKGAIEAMRYIYTKDKGLFDAQSLL